MITLDPIAQPLPAMRTWMVRGTKILPDGGQALYTGTTWGRTEEEAQSRHDRLLEIDRRNREAMRSQGPGLDLAGYTFEFIPV